MFRVMRYTIKLVKNRERYGRHKMLAQFETLDDAKLFVEGLDKQTGVYIVWPRWALDELNQDRAA